MGEDPNWDTGRGEGGEQEEEEGGGRRPNRTRENGNGKGWGEETGEDYTIYPSLIVTTNDIHIEELHQQQLPTITARRVARVCNQCAWLEYINNKDGRVHFLQIQ